MSLPITITTPGPRGSSPAPLTGLTSADGFAAAIRDAAAGPDPLLSNRSMSPDAPAGSTEALPEREILPVPETLPAPDGLTAPEILPAPEGPSVAAEPIPLRTTAASLPSAAPATGVAEPTTEAGSVESPLVAAARTDRGVVDADARAESQTRPVTGAHAPASAAQVTAVEHAAPAAQAAPAQQSAPVQHAAAAPASAPVAASAAVPAPLDAQPPAVAPQAIREPSAAHTLRVTQTGDQTPTAPVSAPAGSLPLTPALPADQAAAASPRPVLLPQLSAPVIALARSPQGEHSITLTVTPENLGPVTVRAHISGSSIRLELHSPSEAGREALRVILTDLRRDLSTAAPGASVDVTSRDTGSGSDPQGRFDSQSRSDSQGRFDPQGRAEGQSRGEPRHARADDGAAPDTPARASVTALPASTPELPSSHPRIDVYA